MENIGLNQTKTFSIRMKDIQTSLSIKLNTNYPKTVIAGITIAIIACCIAAYKVITDQLEIKEIKDLTLKSSKDLVKVSPKEYDQLCDIHDKYSCYTLDTYTHEGKKGNRFFYEKAGYKFYSKAHIINKYKLEERKESKYCKYHGYDSLIYIDSEDERFDQIKNIKPSYKIDKLKNSILIDKKTFDKFMLEKAKPLYNNAAIVDLDFESLNKLDDQIQKIRREASNIKNKKLCISIPSYTYIGEYDVDKKYIAYEKGSLDECLSKINY